MLDGTTNRANKPPRPSTHRVLGSVSNIKAHGTKSKSLASGSVASDATASKHSRDKPRPTRNTQMSKHTGETRKSLRRTAETKS